MKRMCTIVVLVCLIPVSLFSTMKPKTNKKIEKPTIVDPFNGRLYDEEEVESAFNWFQKQGKNYLEKKLKSEYETQAEYENRINSINSIDTNVYYFIIPKATKYNAENKVLSVLFAGGKAKDKSYYFEFLTSNIEQDTKIETPFDFSLDGTLESAYYGKMLIRNYDKIQHSFRSMDSIRHENTLFQAKIIVKIDSLLNPDKAREFSENDNILFVIGLKNIDVKYYNEDSVLYAKAEPGELVEYLFVTYEYLADLIEVVIYDKENQKVLRRIPIEH